MSTIHEKTLPHPGPSKISSGLIFILAVAFGAIVANIYYSQALVVLIGNHLNFNPAWTGFIVTLTQLGYGVGEENVYMGC